jgi:hypothetical protein
MSTTYASDKLVAVRSFSHRLDGDEVIIGDLDRQVFLAIPAEGLDILNSLAAGRSVDETVRMYEEKYGETPDIDDFLSALEKEGFVSFGAPTVAADERGPADGRGPADEPGHNDGQDHGHGHGRRVHEFKRWNFDWISQSAAQKITSVPVLVLLGLIIVAGLTMIVTDPGVVPDSSILLFPDGHIAEMVLATFGIALFGLFLHEMGHVLVARSTGSSASIGIGNLMYLLVAQTHMNGLWLASKRRRYLAFMIGIVLDVASAAVLVGVLWATRRGLIHPPPAVLTLAKTGFLTYSLRVNFQVFMYLRTDIYYVFSTAMKCRNLMGDTEVLLRNVFNRLTFRPERVQDQSGIPRRERIKIRFYAVFYVLGRILALTVLFGLIIPVLFAYLKELYLLVTGQPAHFKAIDFAVLAIILFFLNGTGLYMWVRNLIKGHFERRHAREMARAAAA